jgi:general secretion pathway protein G
LKFFSFKSEDSPKTHTAGFTLIEVMIVVAITGILGSIAIPNYIKYKEKARIEVAITELRFIEKDIMNFAAEFGDFPDDLSEIGMDQVLDPWGRPYNYLRIQGVYDGKGKKGPLRKDHAQVPVNTDFDLYSVGKDGRSASAFTSKWSKDDLVRANNGGYIGLVSDY